MLPIDSGSRGPTIRERRRSLASDVGVPSPRPICMTRSATVSIVEQGYSPTRVANQEPSDILGGSSRVDRPHGEEKTCLLST